MVTEGRKAAEELADSFMKHIDAATMQSCMAGLRMRFQSGKSKVTLKAILSADRGGSVQRRFWECELWWLFMGTGSIRHDELMESHFFRYLETRWLPSVNEQNSRIL